METFSSDLVLLPDPLGDRVIKEVNPPPHKPIPSKLVFSNIGINSRIPNWVVLKECFTREAKLSKIDLLKIVNDFTEVVKKEPNIVKVADPVTIVGDVHGQYYDLLKILEVGGMPDQTKYVFLGDYVDRGSFSIEVCILLFSLKLNFIENVVLLRGNHECKQMTTYFNFHNECLIKYDEEVYCRIMEAFNSLPLAVIVNSKFFGVHGGISPHADYLENIETINRFEEIPKDGLICDLMWSDPLEEEFEAVSLDWEINTKRGCSFNFGAKSLIPFLVNNNMVSLIRAHEAQIEGFKMYRWNKKVDFPSCVTVFSAANYCDVYGNKGAVIKFKSNQFNLVQFSCNPHPFFLPDFQNLFSWSLPFISEKSKVSIYYSS